MSFEQRVMVLCAQALAANDEADTGKILTELRLVLHQQIERLRSDLLVAYGTSMIRPVVVEDARRQIGPVASDAATTAQPVERVSPRTWRQVVHEIAGETNHEKALQLSRELTLLLQGQARAPGSC